MRGIIDRFEGENVVVEIERKGIRVYDRKLFPENIKEGDVVIFKDNSFIVDEEETKKRREYIKKLFNDLIDKGTE